MLRGFFLPHYNIGPGLVNSSSRYHQLTNRGMLIEIFGAEISDNPMDEPEAPCQALRTQAEFDDRE